MLCDRFLHRVQGYRGKYYVIFLYTVLFALAINGHGDRIPAEINLKHAAQVICHVGSAVGQIVANDENTPRRRCSAGALLGLRSHTLARPTPL